MIISVARMLGSTESFIWSPFPKQTPPPSPRSLKQLISSNTTWTSSQETQKRREAVGGETESESPKCAWRGCDGRGDLPLLRRRTWGRHSCSPSPPATTRGLWWTRLSLERWANVRTTQWRDLSGRLCARVCVCVCVVFWHYHIWTDSS